MASKSQIYGQADIWDLSDYFNGDASQTSFLWYVPAQTLSSQMYPYDFSDVWGILPAFTAFTFISEPLDTYGLETIITGFQVTDQFKTYSYQEAPWTLTTSVTNLVVADQFKQYANSDLWGITTTIPAFSVLTNGISYSNNDTWTLETSVTGVTVT